MKSDLELVSDTLDGHNEAFGVLVTRYRDCVYGLALSFLGDFEAAYDISQEVFLRAFLNLNRLADAGKLSPWLRAITANACRMRLRKRRDSVPIDHLDREDAVPVEAPHPEQPDEALERKEIRRTVLRALSSLSERNRQALTLYYIDGLSTPEIASFLDTSPSAVRQRIRRARNGLKKEMLTMVKDTLQDEAPGEAFDGELEALLEQARTLFLREEYRAAIPALEQASQVAPDDTLVAMLLSDAYMRTRKPGKPGGEREPYEKARAVLRALIDRQPENLLARIHLTRLEAGMENFQHLHKTHTEMLRLARGTPFEGLAHFYTACIYAPRKKHDEAVGHFRKAIEHMPEWADWICLQMAGAYYVIGDFRGGIAVLKESISISESQPGRPFEDAFKRMFGKTYWAFHHRADDRLIVLFLAHSSLAGCHMKVGEPDVAREHLRTALDYLNKKELTSVRQRLVGDLLRISDSMFPELSGEPAVKALREEAG